MGKRRTKKEKRKANHPFTMSWEPSYSESKQGDFEATVKGQNSKTKKSQIEKGARSKQANNSAKLQSVETVRHDIIRSLSIAGFILGLEIMLYLAWNTNLI